MNDRAHSAGPASEPNNQDLLIWALYQLGGSDQFVDVEDVYVECFRLAPARLGWRTRPDLPDYKKCAKALQSVEATTHPGFLAAQGRYLRRLTSAGVKWCQSWESDLTNLYGGGTAIKAPANTEKSRALRELRTHPVFDEWAKSRALSFSWGDVADAFHCSPSSATSVWERRLDEMTRIANEADDPEVAEFVAAVATRLVERKGAR